MGILNELLTIKSFREAKAETLLRKQRLELHEASVRREAALQKLQAYHEEATRRERKLFEGLCSGIVLLRDIEDVQHAVSQIRAQENEHAKDLETAEKDKSEQVRRVEERKLDHRTAARVAQKFLDLTVGFAEEAARQVERQEDAEMEEAAANNTERRGWSDIDMEEAP